MYACMYMYVCMYVCMYVYVYLYVCTYVYNMYACMYVRMYAYEDAVRLTHYLCLLSTFRVTGAKYSICSILLVVRITLGIPVSPIVFEEYFNDQKLVCEC